MPLMFTAAAMLSLIAGAKAALFAPNSRVSFFPPAIHANG